LNILFFTVKSDNFDLVLTADKFTSCESMLISQNLDRLSVCMWIVGMQSESPFLTVVDDK